MKAGWEAVIGLEVHVQLRTASKMFCACSNLYGATPNSLTCPVCLGLPGTLPTLNDEAVRMGLAFGLAVSAQISDRSTFYRKQYFYADLPKGYQITQGPVALVQGGHLSVPGDPEVRGQTGPIQVRLERAHLEEDAGKSSHDLGPRGSYVDLNRAGVPLLEIVGMPDLRSPQEASDYLKVLHRLVTFLGICDGNLEEGSFRCDANISVRPLGAQAYGTRVEVKNLNSFRFVKQALEFEIARHIELLESGQTVVQETRGWDGQAGETRGQRAKEMALDYRYFPEPDLPDLTIASSEIEQVRANLPELPGVREARFQSHHGLTAYEAGMLLQSPGFADFFEATAQACGDGKQAANWMLGEVSRALNLRGCALEALPLTPKQLAELIGLVKDGTLNLNTAREQVLPAVLQGEGMPSQIVEARGLAQVSDRAAVMALVDSILEAHPTQAAECRAGNARLRGFLVGQVMKAGGGKLPPRLVNEVMDEKLAG